MTMMGDFSLVCGRVEEKIGNTDLVKAKGVEQLW